MQDYKTDSENPETLDETDMFDEIGSSFGAALKKLFVFVCFGPGMLGVAWIIGRLFKR